MPSTYASRMVRLVRVAILVILVFWTLSLIVALGRPETGPVEDAVLLLLVTGSIALSVPVHRIGARRGPTAQPAGG